MKVKKRFLDNRLIAKNIAIIKEFCGLAVKPCLCFQGIRKLFGTNEKYFNVIISDNNFFNGMDYRKLEKCARKGLFRRVEANGYKRVAVFLNSN